MTDASTVMMAASAALVGLGIASAASLRAWNGWLDLKRLQLEASRSGPRAAGTKPELVDLKDRVRRLEAIASGIEI